jgi:hypothetical protein
LLAFFAFANLVRAFFNVAFALVTAFDAARTDGFFFAAARFFGAAFLVVFLAVAMVVVFDYSE